MSPSFSSSVPSQFDLVIGGAGLAGLTLALALKEALGSHFSIALCDPRLHASSKEDPTTHRAFALVPGPRRMFEALGIWKDLELHAFPLRKMHMTDSPDTDPLRLPFLTLEDHVLAGEPLAHMLYHRDMEALLLEKTRDLGVTFYTTAITEFHAQSDNMYVHLADNICLTTPLLVAADGGQSPLRTRAGLSSLTWDYEQEALVATLHHERDHEGQAWQHFRSPVGPLALLPLSPHFSSIVWVESRAEAQRLVNLDPALACQCLRERLGGSPLGHFDFHDPLSHWPLVFQMAHDFHKPRFVLVGDAAHTFHPLAGQGLNLGFRDVAVLAEQLVSSLHIGGDIGTFSVLKAYEQARRFDTFVNGLTFDGLNRLFTSSSASLKFFRDLGLRVVDRTPLLQRFLAWEASGLSGIVPHLFQGLSLRTL